MPLNLIKQTKKFLSSITMATRAPHKCIFMHIFKIYANICKYMLLCIHNCISFCLVWYTGLSVTVFFNVHSSEYWAGSLLLNFNNLWTSRLGLHKTPTASLQKGKISLMSVLYMTLNDTPVIVELWGTRSTPLLPSLPSPLWPGVIAPGRILSMGQIELNWILMLNWIVWNITVYMCKIYTGHWPSG